MPGPQYCAPCRRLLSGAVQFKEQEHFIHHHDANSLEESLEMHCAICSLAYGQSFQHRPILDGTRGYFFSPDDPSEKVLHLYWDWPKLRAPEIIFVPWENMLDYRLPRPLSSRTDSSSALNFVLRKYRECKDTHVGCRSKNSKGEFPPLRVIDVGESRSSHVHLQDTRDFTDAAYICLSYCWGKTQPLLLTKQTETILYDGISISTLPKTFQDAVYVTRVLGIQYLWIDALCIFQDNEADWSHEASRMRLVYSHAVCTLAATSSENSTGGLFFDRNPDTLQPLCVEFIDTPDSNDLRYELDYPSPALYWCDIKNTWTHNVEWAPLAQRAWVCQERHLSSRIIHFTTCGLFWECHKDKASENYPNGIPKWAEPFWCENQTVLKQRIHQHEDQLMTSSPRLTSSDKISLKKHIDATLVGDIYFAWFQFRIAYSKCNLTREADKLVAIQGIADHMSTVVSDQLIAGLWRNHLLVDLCWHKFDQYAVHRELMKWRAPTWSWASVDGTIWVSLVYRDHRHCPGWRLPSEIDSVDVKSRPSGELEHATLKIRCRPISAIVRPDKDFQRAFSVFGTLSFTNSMVQMHAASNKGNPELSIDIDGPSWEKPQSVFMVVLQECRHEAGFVGLDTDILKGQSSESEEDDLEGAIEGLLLVLQCEDKNIFQRVGLFRVSGADGITKLSREYETAKKSTIILI